MVCARRGLWNDAPGGGMERRLRRNAFSDDEAIGTGGVMCRAHDAGHRVVLVTCTRGEEGEAAPGSVPEGRPLGEHRSEEVARAAEAIGLEAVRKRQETPEPDGRLIGVGFATYTEQDRKSTRLNSSHMSESRMPSSA